MSNLVEARQDIELEEARFRGGVSEAFATKIGQSLNFVNRRQYDKHSWNLNGPYKTGQGSTGVDGIFTFLFDAEIVGFYYFSGNVISPSGYTEVDLHWYDVATGADQGTIFSTKPRVDSTAANNSYTVRDVLNSTTLKNPTGHTLAVLNKTQFDAGDALRLDLDSAMSGANNFQFSIFFRPR
jgi:hypothetical protein